MKEFVRPNILALKPYSSARDEFSGSDGVFLDANENPFGSLNRYPDPYQIELKEKLSTLKNISTNNIFIGNGSDEVIDVLFRIFCSPGIDRIIICPPTYGMYEVSANINNVEVVKIPMNEKFQLNIESILNKNDRTKLIFLCTPNNPTGNTLNDVDKVLKQFKGIVAVDEAYIDFSDAGSYIKKLAQYPNLVVMQTFSKAWGIAAARVGVAYAGSEIITLMNKIKPPYNVSALNQQAAIEVLNNQQKFEEQIQLILEQRNWLQNELKSISCVQKFYPSDANFLLVEVTDANKIYSALVEKKVIIRNRHTTVENCIRITVGSPDENKKLIEELKKL